VSIYGLFWVVFENGKLHVGRNLTKFIREIRVVLSLFSSLFSGSVLVFKSVERGPSMFSAMYYFLIKFH